MDARILVDGENAEDLRSLYGWLADEWELRGLVRLIPADVGRTDLGGVVDAVTVAVGTGGAGTILARSLVTWLQVRRTTARLVIRRGDRELTLDLQTTDKVLPLIERLLEHGNEP